MTTKWKTKALITSKAALGQSNPPCYNDSSSRSWRWSWWWRGWRRRGTSTLANSGSRWPLRTGPRYDDNDVFDYSLDNKRWWDQSKTESEAQTSRDIELVVQEEADEGNQFSSPWTSSSLHHHHQICHHHHLYIIIISITIISIDITIKSINWHIRPQARSWKFSTRRRMGSLFPPTMKRRGCRHLLTTSKDYSTENFRNTTEGTWWECLASLWFKREPSSV